MKWHVALNPTAGRRTLDVEKARKKIEQLDAECTVVVPDTADEFVASVQQAVADGYTHFGFAGGDGTFHTGLNAILGTRPDFRPTLAFLAHGSGADLIRTFALPRSFDASLRLLTAGDPYVMDVARMEGSFGVRYFANVADIGVAARAVSGAERMPRFVGSIRYTAAFWLALPRFRPAHVAVAGPSRTIETTALNVVIANGQFFAGGMNIAPQAAISDGLLDVEVFEAPRRNAFTVMPRVIRGLHVRMPSVRTMRAASFTIDVPDHWPIEADGELVGTGSVSVSAVPGAIALMV